jgi:hypothetical protein
VVEMRGVYGTGLPQGSGQRLTAVEGVGFGCLVCWKVGW